MKTLIGLLLLMTVCGFSALAVPQYSVDMGSKNGAPGSFTMLTDCNSFSFDVDFGKLGASGSLGYYTYTDDINDYVVGDKTFSKKDGNRVDLGALREGENVGFYVVRNNGNVIEHIYFQNNGDGNYSLVYNKNGGNGAITETVISNISVGSTNRPAGQPLPGVIVTLAIGGAGVFVHNRRIRRRRRQ